MFTYALASFTIKFKLPSNWSLALILSVLAFVGLAHVTVSADK